MADDPIFESAAIWPDDGPPRSRLNGDVYFSRDDGLAESRAVFLAGCGLPDGWAWRRVFTVAELGFGTGLNIAALLHLWAGSRHEDQILRVFSVESRPLTAADASRALSIWPELAPVAALMIARWPGQARGVHRMELPELSATIDVAVMEAEAALGGWDGRADAWFLDGFSPARTAGAADDIWRPAIFDLIGRRSAAGARVATYTIAGAVRRNLAESGFEVTRAPGHGRKRERLEARRPGEPVDPPPPRVAIIGAGIAGASLGRAFRALGVEPGVFDAVGPGAGASGAAVALMAPRLDAGLGDGAALFAQAARRAAQLYDETPGAVVTRGALQLAQGPKDPHRFAAIAGSDLFEPGDMIRLTGDEASARLGEPAPEGLAIAGARVVHPGAILSAWLGEVASARVAALRREGNGWALLDADGRCLGEAEVVCLACAMEVVGLAGGIAMTAVRGQAAVARVAGLVGAVSFGAYALPAGEAIFFGATHDRDDHDRAPRPSDRERNLLAIEAALPALADRLRGAETTDWCAIRATTHDYLPLAGAAPDWGPGLIALTGLGSRGLCLAPLLAEHLAARVMGVASPLPSPLAELAAPGRFAARAARRGRPAQAPPPDASRRQPEDVVQGRFSPGGS